VSSGIWELHRDHKDGVSKVKIFTSEFYKYNSAFYRSFITKVWFTDNLKVASR